MSVESSILRVSLGSAVLLNLTNKKVDCLPTTIYVMTPGKCVRDCMYCSEAKNSSSLPNMLSRVIWPPFPMNDVIDRIKNGDFKRLCIQTVNNKISNKVVEKVLKEISTYIPVSVCINTYSEKIIDKIFLLGAERVGLPIDVANPKLHKTIRGGNFFKKLQFILKMADKYKEKITTHIIVGLGENDREILSLYDTFTKNGIKVALFAFTPVRGTKLQDLNPPDIVRYRKIQVATKLIEKGVPLSEFVFEKDRLIKLPKISTDEIRKLNPFTTRGCPNCNRPYYNEKPKGTMYNYPYKLSEEEWKKEISLLKL